MTDAKDQRRRPQLRATFVLLPLLALAALLSWSFASPVGASPDDDFHLTSIWCATGEKQDACATTTDPDTRIVPYDVALAPSCYAFQPEESAACQGEDFGLTPSETFVTDRGNFDGLYPPVYYFVMSIFVGPNVEASVIAMRVVNSVFFVGLVTTLYAVLPKHRRSTLLWSLVVSVVPLGIFLIASTNPSGWAILSAGTLLLSLLGYFETRGRQMGALAGIAALSTVIGAGARADAAAYAGVAIVAVLILKVERTKRFALSALLPVALALVAVAFFLSAGQSRSAAAGLPNDAGPVDVSAFAITSFLSAPELWVGVFGDSALGWLDTVLPAIVWVAAFGAFCAVVFAGLRVRSKRKSFALAWVLGVLWAFPTILLVQSRATVGEIVQPRYILPLVLLLAVVALLQPTAQRLTFSRLQLIALVGALATANSVALTFNLRRYTTGTDVGGFNLDAQVEWWWSLPVSPMGVWVGGSLAFAGMLVVLAMTEWPGRSVRSPARAQASAHIEQDVDARVH